MTGRRLAMGALRMTVVLLALNYAKAQTRYEPCGDGSPVPVSFQFSDCLEKCIVVAGDEVQFEIEFTVPRRVDSFNVFFDIVTSTNIRNVTRLSLPQDGCTLLVNESCPIRKGKTVLLRATAGVVDFGKEVVIIAEFRLMHKGKTLSCSAIPVLDVKRPARLPPNPAP